MKTLIETTEWNQEFTVPNHVYFVSDNREKLFAYVQSSSNTIKEFKKPYSFSTRGRKFKEINNTWGYLPPEDIKLVSKSWVVKGSKGNEYTVTEQDNQLSCSCTGFKYRNTCKHLDLA